MRALKFKDGQYSGHDPYSRVRCLNDRTRIPRQPTIKQRARLERLQRLDELEADRLRTRQRAQ